MTETGELKMCISIEGFKEKKRALWKYGHEKYANKSLITAEHCTVYQKPCGRKQNQQQIIMKNKMRNSY